MLAIGVANPQHAVGMVHAALEPLDLVEEIEKPPDPGAVGRTHERVARELVVDDAGRGDLPSVLFRVHERPALDPHGGQQAGGLFGVPVIVEMEVELFRHDGRDGVGGEHTGEGKEPLEVDGAMQGLAPLLLILQAGLLAEGGAEDERGFPACEVEETGDEVVHSLVAEEDRRTQFRLLFGRRLLLKSSGSMFRQYRCWKWAVLLEKKVAKSGLSLRYAWRKRSNWRRSRIAARFQRRLPFPSEPSCRTTAAMVEDERPCLNMKV